VNHVFFVDLVSILKEKEVEECLVWVAELEEMQSFQAGKRREAS
jgi:hypothetical protein